jgi:hypothetical protein
LFYHFSSFGVISCFYFSWCNHGSRIFINDIFFATKVACLQQISHLFHQFVIFFLSIFVGVSSTIPQYYQQLIFTSLIFHYFTIIEFNVKVIQNFKPYQSVYYCNYFTNSIVCWVLYSSNEFLSVPWLFSL